MKKYLDSNFSTIRSELSAPRDDYRRSIPEVKAELEGVREQHEEVLHSIEFSSARMNIIERHLRQKNGLTHRCTRREINDHGGAAEKDGSARPRQQSNNHRTE